MTKTSSSILNAVLVHGAAPLTLAALADVTAISPRAVSEHVGRMRSAGILERDHNGVRFGPAVGLVASVEIGDRSTRAALVDANGVVRNLVVIDATRQLDDSVVAIMGRAASALRECLAQAQHDPSLATADHLRPLGIICTVPSAVGRDGIVRGHALRDREWRVRPVTEHLAVALPDDLRSIPLDYMNNANADALAVAFDRARERGLTQEGPSEHSEVVITIRLSHGVGAGTVQLARYERRGSFSLTRSRLVVGSTGLAGELGHLPMFRSDLRDINAGLLPGLKPVAAVECSCHNKDHLESYVTLPALQKRMAASGIPCELPPKSDGSSWLEEPDELAHRCLSDIGRLVARALSSTILMLDPKIVTLTGTLGLESVREGMVREQHRWSEGVQNAVTVRTLASEIRDVVTLRGAAIAVLRRRVWKEQGLQKSSL